MTRLEHNDHQPTVGESAPILPPLISREEFSKLNTLLQLRTSYDAVKRGDIKSAITRQLRAEAVWSALTMSPRQREQDGVLLIATGVVKDGHIAPPSTPFESYQIYAVFPYNKNVDHFVSVNGNDLPHSGLRETVNTQVDEIRSEHPSEKHSRLMFQIKLIDSLLQKETSEESVSELNFLKRKYLLDCLIISSELQYENSSLTRELYTTEADSKSGNLIVKMNLAAERTLLRRLEQEDTSVVLRDSDVIISTSIDQKSLAQAYTNFLADPKNASEQEAVNAGVCRIIGIEALSSEEPVSSDETHATEEFDRVESSSKPTATHRQKRLSRKGKAQTKKTVARFTSFADMRETDETSGQEVREEGESLPTPQKKKVKTKQELTPEVIVRQLLDANEAERAALGITMISVGPLNREYALYLIFSSTDSRKLMQLRRRDLLQEGDNLDTLNHLITEKTHMREETLGDTYNRLLTEIIFTDLDLNQLRGEEQKFHTERSSGAYDKDIDEIKKEIKAKNELKKQLFIEFLTTAKKMKDEYPYLPPLWIRQPDSVEEVVTLALYKVKEHKKSEYLQGEINFSIPSGVREPYLATLRLKSATQRKRSKGDSIDTKIVDLLLEPQMGYRTQEEKEKLPAEFLPFMQLPLLEKLKHAYDRIRESRDGQFDRNKANLMKRIAVQQVIQSVDKARSLDLDIIVIGPQDEKGKLVISDQEFSQYSLFVTFPWGSEKRFFEVLRSDLPKDSLSKKPSSWSELQFWDTLVKRSAEVYPERPEDRYNRAIYEIHAIESQIKVLSDQKDPSNPHNLWIDSVIDGLHERKYPFILAYLEAADQLQMAEPSLKHLYDFKTKIDDIGKLEMYSVVDLAMRDHRLLQTESKGKLQITQVAFETGINFDKLQQYALLYKQGDHSEINNAALKILDKFNRGVSVTSRRERLTKTEEMGSDELALRLRGTFSEKSDYLQRFRDLSLEEKLVALPKDRQKHFNGKLDAKRYLYEERLTIRDAFNTSAPERERLGIQLFAIAPNVDGIITCEDPLTSQYQIYMIYPQGEKVIVIDTNRVGITTDPFISSRSTSDDLVYWDTLVSSQAEVWDEWQEPSYNRYINELVQVDKVLEIAYQNGEASEVERYKYRRLFLLASYFELAYALYNRYPRLENLFTWEDRGEKVDFALYPIKDYNITEILLQQKDSSAISRKKKPILLSFNYDELWNAYNEFYESEVNPVATIYDVLGIRVNNNSEGEE